MLNQSADIPAVKLDGPPADLTASPSSGAEVSRLNTSDICEVVRMDRDLTWFFVGDSFSGNGSDSLPGRSGRFVDHLTGFIRTELRRERDILVDATFPAATMESVSLRCEEMLRCHAPDIVVLSCGHLQGEVKAGQCERFESTFLNVLRRFQEGGAVTLVNTPPYLPVEDERQLIDHLIYVEAIRGCTAEEGVMLIDHWAHWENQIVGEEASPAWSEGNGLPTHLGLCQMTDLFARASGLRMLSAASAIELAT